MNLHFAKFKIKYNQKHLDIGVLHTNGKMKHGGVTFVNLCLIRCYKYGGSLIINQFSY